MPNPISASTGPPVTLLLEKPNQLRLRLLHNGEAIKQEDCVVSFDTGGTFSNKTDGMGVLEVDVPMGAGSAKLEVPRLKMRCVLRPFMALFERFYGPLAGASARLQQLGYYHGPHDGSESPALRQALIAFQRKHNLQESGSFDAATRDALRQVYGS